MFSLFKTYLWLEMSCHSSTKSSLQSTSLKTVCCSRDPFMHNAAIYYMASWQVMLSHCSPLVFFQVLKVSIWIVGITAGNLKIILPICPRHTCNWMSYIIMFKYDESIHFALIMKGASQFLESLNRVRSTDVSPPGQKINYHESPVSQKIVLIILSAEGIVLAFFFLGRYGVMSFQTCLVLEFQQWHHLASQSQCSGHHHSQQHVSISCEATVLYAFL